MIVRSEKIKAFSLFWQFSLDFISQLMEDFTYEIFKRKSRKQNI